MQLAKSRALVAVLRGSIILMMCCSGAVVHAADWPIFRGNPALTGVAYWRFLTSPACSGLSKTGGPVKSSAVIGEGKVFIGSNDGQIHALEFASGHETWAFKAGSPVQAPPLLANHSVFAGSVDGIFYALDAADGHQLWKYATDGKILASANAVPLPMARRASWSEATISNFIASTPPTARRSGLTKPAITSTAPAPWPAARQFLADATRLSTCWTGHGAKIKEIDAGAYIAASARWREIAPTSAITTTSFCALISSGQGRLAL
jgi:hypothetical protein